MNRLKLKPRALLPLAPIILFMFAGVRPRTYFAADVTIPPFFIVNDAQGPNDVPGQKDLTRLGRWNHSAIGDPLNGNLDIFASFDSIDPESQTFNFCALLDKNGNGKADYAICPQVKNFGTNQNPIPKMDTGAGSPYTNGVVVYSCDDSQLLNCGGATVMAPPSSLKAGDLIGVDSTKELTTNTDPWPQQDEGNGYDTTVRVLVKLTDIDLNAKLANVCTYPSASPSSSPSDCLANAGGGFLNIVKNTTGGNGTFTFNVSPVPGTNSGGACNPAGTGCKSYSVTTSGGTGATGVSLAPGTNVSVQEWDQSPAWNFESASCVIEDSNFSTGNLAYSARTITGITVLADTITTCTFNNKKQPAKITVTKVMINDNGGTATSSQYTLKVGSTIVTSGVQTTIPDGVYPISETGPTAGYTASFGGDCSSTGMITMQSGGTYSCTITNNDNPPSLTLSKIVIKDNGGTASATDWTLSAAGPTPISGAGGASSGSSFKAGTYTLSESGGPNGYSASAWSCTGGTQSGSQITLGLGQSATCTITNDDIAATLTVIKKVVNDNGGTKNPSDFTMTVTGNSPSSASFPGALAGTTVTMKQGSYSVSESGPSGYSQSLSGGCSGTIALAETKTCTVTNNDIPPGLTLIKFVNNGSINDSAAPPSVFTLVTSGGPTNFSGPGSGISSGPAFQAGTYTLGETGPSGYTASAWSCTGQGTQSGNQINLGIAQTATCSITNTLSNIPPAVKVDKSVTPKNLDSNGGTVTFTVTVTNLGGSYDPFTITSLTDTIYGDLTNAADAKPQDNNTCGGAVGTVIPGGGSYTCTWTSYFPPLPASQVLSEHDIATVVGHDDDNAGASSIGTASDDATVTQALPIVITNGACKIDTFTRIFTQDSAYHFTSTNSGQLFYNVSISGVPGEKRHVTLELPWPFVTQGSLAIHVYDSVDWVNNCFTNFGGGYSIDNSVYLKDYGVYMAAPDPGPYKTGYPAPSLQPWLKTRKVQLEITIPSTGFAFIRQHMDDGLKGPYIDVDGNGVADDIAYGKDGADNALNPNTGAILIPEMFNHPFGMWGFNCSTANPACSIDPAGPNLFISGGASIKNDNQYQKNVGVSGGVLYNGAAVAGITVQLSLGSTFIGAAVTDSSGLYSIAYKHTGNTADYTVKLVNPLTNATVLSGGGTISGMPGSTTKSVTMKSNGSVIVNFPLVP